MVGCRLNGVRTWPLHLFDARTLTTFNYVEYYCNANVVALAFREIPGVSDFAKALLETL